MGHNLHVAVLLQGKVTPRHGPNYWLARMFLRLSYEATGDLPRALAEFQRANGTTTIPWPSAELGHAYAILGKKREAEEILEQLKDRSKQSYYPLMVSPRFISGSATRSRPLPRSKRHMRIVPCS